MAKFVFEMPKEILKDFQKIHDNSEQIFGEMTKAGAEAAMQNVKANVPIPEMSSHVKLSKTYKTPSDDGINTKVYISGKLNGSVGTSFTRRGRAGSKKYTSYDGVPMEFLATIFEYGTSARYTDNGAYRGIITKKPFFRRSFSKSKIEKAMLAAQKKASGGLLK